MDYSAASAYTYAKMSSMLSRLFVGEGAMPLFEAKSLAGLWDIVFKTPVPQLPESLLANKIETEAVNRFISQYEKILDIFSSPDPFLKALIKRFDVENLKLISASLSLNEMEMPCIVDLKQYAELDYSAWPDIKKITANSRFSWYDKVPLADERVEMDIRLDLEEIQFLWKTVHKISDSSRNVLVEYFQKLFSVRNMLWALRLKVYYKMQNEDIVKKLFYVSKEPSPEDPICRYAYEVLSRETDNYDAWKNWRFASFLNFYEDGNIWKIDPVWIEQKFRFGEAGRARKIFHENPMTYASLVMFFILKQQEVDCIRAATEALRLNATKADAMFASGVQFEEM